MEPGKGFQGQVELETRVETVGRFRQSFHPRKSDERVSF